MNKMWEVIEKESREGSEMKHGNYRYGSRSGMRYGMRDSEGNPSYRMGMRDDVQDAYDCGFEDGYSEAMKKIFHIIKNAD